MSEEPPQAKAKGLSCCLPVPSSQQGTAVDSLSSMITVAA